MKSYIFWFLALAVSAVAQSTPTEAAPAVLKSEGGRYVFGQVGPARADQYLLDTKTGRLWQIVVDEQKRQQLLAVPFVGILLGEDAYIPDTDEDVAYQKQLARERAGLRLKKQMEEVEKKK